MSYALKRMCITASMMLWEEATLWNLKLGALGSLAARPYCLPALLQAAEGPRQDISGVVVAQGSLVPGAERGISYKGTTQTACPSWVGLMNRRLSEVEATARERVGVSRKPCSPSSDNLGSQANTNMKNRSPSEIL